MQFLLGWILRSSVLILAGAGVLWALRVKNASARLAVWTALLAGSLAIPLLARALPNVPLVITRTTAAVPAFGGFQLTPPINESAISSPEQPHQRAPHRFDWSLAVALAYAALTAMLLLRIGIGVVLSFRLRRRSDPTGIEGVRESREINSPLTLGVLRPVVVLPADWREWDEAKTAAVLAHERSHIQRRDPIVQLVSAIHRALLWISPLSWLLHRSLIQSAEDASDDAAIAATANPIGYAEVLLQFIGRGVSPAGIGMARYGRPDKRIERILNSAPAGRFTRWSAAGIFVLASPLAYFAATAAPQAQRILRFPSLPAPPTAPAPVQIAQAQRTPEPARALDPVPAFEVVSIKPLPPAPAGGGRSGSPGDGPVCRPLRYTTGMVAGAATTARLIQDAYGLSPYQVSGGPSWINDDRFCLEAKSMGRAEQDQLKLMLRPMLADRFKLVLRQETKDMPVYMMRVAKKGLLFEMKPGESMTGPISAEDLKAAGYEFRIRLDESASPKVLVTRNTTQGLAALLSDVPLDLDRPVLDKTGLKGSYVFVMRWTDDDFRSDFEQQFGLKLDPQKAPLPSLVIESIEKPSPN